MLLVPLRSFSVHSIVPSVLLVLAAATASSCSTVPGENSPEHAALLANPPAELTDRVDSGFRKRVAFIEDREIKSYLEKIAAKLVPNAKTKIQVTLVSTTTAEYTPSIWTIPGGQIYFDLRILRAMSFENEIAAGLALAWERAEGSPFRERLIKEAEQTDPDPMKIWVFDEVENQLAVESSIDRLYKAGYDPRGLVNYFDRIPQKVKGTLDPDNESMKGKARRTITFYAPLLNPIVRTEGFYKMRKRLEHL